MDGLWIVDYVEGSQPGGGKNNVMPGITCDTEDHTRTAVDVFFLFFRKVRPDKERETPSTLFSRVLDALDDELSSSSSSFSVLSTRLCHRPTRENQPAKPASQPEPASQPAEDNIAGRANASQHSPLSRRSCSPPSRRSCSPLSRRSCSVTYDDDADTDPDFSKTTGPSPGLPAKS